MVLDTLSRAAVVHVQIGQLEDRTEADGSTWTTAIYKKTVDSPIDVIKTGLVGDEHTGGGYDVDRAVCCQSLAHYHFWRSYFRRDFPLGTFGENLILDGFLDEDPSRDLQGAVRMRSLRTQHSVHFANSVQV